MSEHTPAPWLVGVTLDKTYDCHWPVFRLRDLGTTDPDSEEIRANRRLIEAAPDLLEACKDAAYLYDLLSLSPLAAAAKYGPDYEPPTDADCLEIRSTLEAVIAKAEGTQ